MPEAGWYDDPEHPTQLRYWDGTRWTEERRASDVPPPPPFAPPFAEATAWTSAAPPRTFGEAVQVCLRKYVDFQGRASRSEYWYFFLFTVLAGLVAAAFSVRLENAVNVLLFLPTMSAGARRLHDIGRSGWSLLWWLIPILGWIIIIARLARAGDPGPNAYG
jgi:uncharacterized membrane protein YhaH (DUF805 family)